MGKRQDGKVWVTFSQKANVSDVRNSSSFVWFSKWKSYLNEFSFSCNTKCQLVSSFVCAIPETRIMRRRRNDKRSLFSLFYFSPAHNTKMYVVKCAAKLSQKLNEWEASTLYNFCCCSWSFFELFITFNRTWKGKVCLVTVLFWWNVRGKKKKKRKIHKIIIDKKMVSMY